MAIWRWDTFTGISDDSFLARQWEFLDCNNVDIINKARYIDGVKVSEYSISEIWSSIWEKILNVKDWTYWALCSSSHTYIGFGFNSDTLDWSQYWAYLVEQIGTDTLPVSYFFKNWYIRQQVYNGASITFNQPIVTNVPTGIPTASCIGAGRIYFAVENVIYTLDTAWTDPSIALSTVKSIPCNNYIPYWYVIKYMYIYNNVMYVCSTNWRETTIYQLTPIQWKSYNEWEINYYHTISGVKAISAYWDKNNLYWISKDSIYLSNGTSSEKVKTVWIYEWATTFSSNSVCTIIDWIFKIADWNTVWEYWHKKPWYRAVLRKNTRTNSISAINWDIECYYTAPKAYVTRLSQFSLYDNWEVTSMPYEADNFNAKKEWTAIRIGHILPAYSLYTSTSILCSIDVQVITDDMEQRGITTFVTVASITTPTTWVAERFTDISIKEISDAIATAWYNSDFQYIKIKVKWNAWDPINVIGNWTKYRKTPKFFGIELTHKEIRKWIPN